MSPTEKRVRGRINRLSAEELAYLAGMVDGDGSVQVRRSHTAAGSVYMPVIRIDNTNRELIEHIDQMVGLGCRFTAKRRATRHKEAYGWSITGFAAALLLIRLLPHLRIKDAHAGFATALLEQCGPRDVRRVLTADQRARGQQIFERVRDLNAGPATLPRLEHVLVPSTSAPHGQRVQQSRGARLNPLPPVTLAYLAGLVDSEGRIGINTITDQRYETTQPRHRVRLDVSSTHLPTLLWLREQTGLGQIGVLTTPGDRLRSAWRWSLWTRQAEQLLVAIRPFLKSKAGQASLALELLDVQAVPVRHRGRWSASHSRKQQRIVARIAELNRRGPY